MDSKENNTFRSVRYLGIDSRQNDYSFIYYNYVVHLFGCVFIIRGIPYQKLRNNCSLNYVIAKRKNKKFKNHVDYHSLTIFSLTNSVRLLIFNKCNIYNY